MPYQVFIRRSAEKILEKLGQRDQKRVYDAVKALADEPRGMKCKKLAGVTDGYRTVVWPYRILYTIDDAGKTVDVYLIAHRKEAYR